MRIPYRAAVLVALVAAPMTLAQPAGDKPRPEPPEARRALQRRLDELDAQRARILHAMERLDAGAPIDDLRAGLEGQRGESRPPRANHEIDPERLLRILRDMNPEVYDRLSAMEQKNPQMASRLRERIIKRMRSDRTIAEMARLLEQDPKAYRLRVEQHALQTRAFRAARRFVEATLAGDADDAAAARAEVRDLLSKQFDLRQQDQGRMIAKAEERLSAARARIDQAAQAREEEVDQRVDELLRRAMSRANARDDDGIRARKNKRGPHTGPERRKNPRFPE